MTTTEAERRQDNYALGRTPRSTTGCVRRRAYGNQRPGGLLDKAGLGPGASCLDAG